MISVIMPVKNGAETIEVALQSILNQTFQDFEIIVIDDHSTDNTVNIVNALAEKTGKIRIIKNGKSLGVTTSLNLALQNAKYEYVARMDADDESLPDRLKLQHDYLQKNPNIAVVGGQVLFMGSTSQHDYHLRYETNSELIKKEMLKNNQLSHPAVMYRKSVILQLGGYRDFFKNAEDYDLWLRLLRHSYEISNLDTLIIRYNLSIGGATIANRWIQYVYHRLAQHAYYFPEDTLNETLYKNIESKYISLRLNYFIATHALTLNCLLKCRQFKKAWAIFKLIPNKLSFYSIKKILLAVIRGLFKIGKGSNVNEFYMLYEIPVP